MKSILTLIALFAFGAFAFVTPVSQVKVVEPTVHVDAYIAGADHVVAVEVDHVAAVVLRQQEVGLHTPLLIYSPAKAVATCFRSQKAIGECFAVATWKIPHKFT
jgi:hypothetical protein